MTIYTHPELQCDAHAACGPFAVCNDNAASLCSCLKGFSVAAPDDWELDKEEEEYMADHWRCHCNMHCCSECLSARPADDVQKDRNRRNSHTLNNSYGDSGLLAFIYRDLQRATRDFSDKIGAGGFGSVFRGSLDKSTAIAVKRLNASYRVEKQLRAEVSSIGILQHTNLVKMVGFCCEGDRRLLVYEHMPNLSLDVHHFRQSSSAAAGAALSWSTRYRIAAGVARA
ncbi:G-type lectin S-receptor-like serine/threonine-protein kinase [Dichanthelium oligosanthes]|uniref:non-specific serine/threonine protein kinase n=1 Tax=Dichanthelium oligosanthes TaxID=888268 RepID=A0A1E5VLV2_9POAL|nr:G-type lectin S-receptor-like serine/threonine-protein kinase [Dichanthelium oligosanthes]